MMKKVLSVLLAAAMVFSLASCSGGGTSSPASSGKEESKASSGSQAESGQTSAGGNSEGVTINFYAHSDGESIVDAHLEAYSKLDTGVTVVKHIIANDDYDDKLKVLAAGSSGDLDVFWVRSPSQVQQYMKNNALEDLAPYAEKSGLDLEPIKNTFLKNVTAEDGSFYGLPMTGSAWMLFYNKELFDAKGLDAPVNLTWDEYCDLAKELTYEEDGTKYWGGICPPWTMNLGASATGEYLDDPEPLTKTVEYAQVLYRMYTGDKSHPGIAEMSAGTFDINSFFGAGNIYMMINGDWEFNLLDVDFEYGAAPLPVFEGAEAESTVGQSSYLCVSKDSQHKQEAYDFIEWYNTSAEGTRISTDFSSVPCYATEEALENYKAKVKVPGVEYRFSAKISDEQGTASYYADVNDAFVEELKLYLLDEESLEDCFNNFYELRNEKMQD